MINLTGTDLHKILEIVKKKINKTIITICYFLNSLNFKKVNKIYIISIN